MTDQIISRAHIRAKARRDFDAGKKRHEHGFNVGAAAIFDWLEEFDRLAAQANSHRYHAAPAGQGRVELRQGVA